MTTNTEQQDPFLIKVWPFYQAPEHLQALSTNGGDEDWLAFVPDALKDDYIGWMDDGGPFGCYKVEQVKVEGGVIRIGSHS